MYAFTQTDLKSKNYFAIKFNFWTVIMKDLCTPLFIGFKKSKMVLACNKIRMNVLIFYTIILSGYKYCIWIIIVRKLM